jgi:hypothetical protein
MTPPRPTRKDLANLKRLIDSAKPPEEFTGVAIDMRPRLGEDARFLRVQNAELHSLLSRKAIEFRAETKRSRDSLTWAWIWFAFAVIQMALNIVLLRVTAR